MTEQEQTHFDNYKVFLANAKKAGIIKDYTIKFNEETHNMELTICSDYNMQYTDLPFILEVEEESVCTTCRTLDHKPATCPNESCSGFYKRTGE